MTRRTQRSYGGSSDPALPTLRDDSETEAVHRARVTLDQSVAQLTEWPYVHRHLPHIDDGFPPGQGADLWASFTMVSALARFQRWEEAHERMEGLVRALGPTHIGSTHIDPMTGDLRGNLLAAPTHSLDRRRIRPRPRSSVSTDGVG